MEGKKKYPVRTAKRKLPIFSKTKRVFTYVYEKRERKGGGGGT